MTTELTDQFQQAQHWINLNARRRVAIAAHLEVRAVLRAAAVLARHGLDDVLIGSYPRNVTIWPGRDVDVFGKLTAESIESIRPGDAYQLFHDVLVSAFDGRITPQPRSIKIDYRGGLLPERTFIKQAARLLHETVDTGEAFDFSVDVVPAVHFGDVWGIPTNDPQQWTRTAAAERWVRTNPEKLTELTQQLNGAIKVHGQGAYVPTVKAVRQIRSWHLGKLKPGGLYFELITHEGFASGAISAESWATITASALTYIAERLRTVTASPLCDPVLQQPYAPAPDQNAIAQAQIVFADLAGAARQALDLDACPAAATWRRIFGENSQAAGGGQSQQTAPIFDLPTNCREDGTLAKPLVAPNILRGTNEARGFGRR